MKILFLTQILPYPPDAGPKIKTWHVLRYLLEKGHHVTLVSYVRKEEEPHIPQLRKIGLEVFPVPIHRSRVKDVLYIVRSILRNRPFLVERDDTAAMRTVLKHLLVKTTYDVIHADQITMTQFVPLPALGSLTPITVFDAHNATYTLIERMQSEASGLYKPFLRREAKQIRRYESFLLQHFRYTLAVTEIDRRLLLDLIPNPRTTNGLEANIHVIPIAVDTHQLEPLPNPPNSMNILTMGTLHYPPNADGIRWFMKEVFPLVQQKAAASLTVVGKNPPKDFLEKAQYSNGVIEITGYVEDLSPYFARSALIVIPVLAGSGMRVRILEAFARGMPVVTTTIGLEGIEATPGEHVLVADSAAQFAADVLRLLQDPSLRQNLARRGRALVEEKYNWQSALKPLDQIYG